VRQVITRLAGPATFAKILAPSSSPSQSTRHCARLQGHAGRQ
jgi:hypothetical protein